VAKPAIALIVVGSGETTPEEIFDLLEDAYPADDYEETGLVVPVDKDLFTKAVQHAVKWYDSDKDVFTIQTKGASLGGRAASRLGSGTQEVGKFTDILSREEFPEEDWDEVHVLIAMPEDADDPDYEFYAEVADLATKAGFPVKDLTAGLDDIVVIDPEDAEEEAEPEVEPEKPARRRRSRAADKEEEPAEEEPVEEKPKPSRRAKKAESVEEVQEATKKVDEPDSVEGRLNAKVASLESRVEALEDVISRLRTVLAGVAPTESASEPEKPAEAEEDTPKRGRGRPRTDFDVRQIWDEDKDDWVPRPKGRLRKGTDWRTIHAETGEVLEEGTA
jgi:hypothetical protein